MHWGIRILLLATAIAGIVIASGTGQVSSDQFSYEGLQTHEVNVFGVFVTYATMGSNQNPAVVYLHGTGGSFEENLATEYKMMSVLAEKYYVIAPDHPGFRRSEVPKRPWTAADYNDYLDFLLGKLQVEKPVIIGQTLGGVLAINYSIEHPDNVSLLILGNAPLAVDDKEITKYVATNVLSPSYEKLFATSLAGVQKINASTILSIPESRMEENLAMYQVMGKTLANILEANQAAETLMTLKTPTTIIWGTYDTQAPVFLGRRLNQLFPNSNIVEYAAGKSAMIERPWELMDLIETSMAQK